MAAQRVKQVLGGSGAVRPGLVFSVAPIGETVAEFPQVLCELGTGACHAMEPVRCGFVRQAVQPELAVPPGELVPSPQHRVGFALASGAEPGHPEQGDHGCD